MKLKNYHSYKNAHSEWIDEIPIHWSITRIKNIGTVNGRVGWKALKASEYVENGYFFLSTPNIKNDDIDFINVNYITYERYIESPEIILQKNDILLVKDGSTLGIVNLIRSLPGHGTVNSSIAVLRLKNQISNYIFYLLKSNFTQNVIKQKKAGMGVPHLFQKDINNFSILLPPIDEQIKIAEYLERKSVIIDKKITLLNKKINYYQELCKSLINESVCQGLNKKVKFKDSGVDWIGKIPEHWEIVRIGTLFVERSEKVNDIDFSPLSVTMQGVVPQLSTAAKTQNGDNRKKVITGDIVINSRSDRKGASGVSNYTGSVSVISIVLRPLSKVFAKYYHYAFKSQSFTEEFYRNGKGIVDDLWSTKYFVMRNIQIFIPPQAEQIDIARYLDENIIKIEKIVTNLNSQIEILREMKSVLINAVVTGKYKVVED